MAGLILCGPEELERRKGLEVKAGAILTPELDSLPTYAGFRAAATAVAPLPTAPQSFGLNNLPNNQPSAAFWGYQDNAGIGSVGDCVEAACIHAIMYWRLQSIGAVPTFVTNNGLTLYEAWTGYTPSNPATDKGTAVATAIANWTTTGIPDDSSTFHKILASLKLNANDVAEVTEACYLLGPVGLALNISTQWVTAFSNGEPWDAVTSPTFEGKAHFVPLIGCSPGGNFVAVSWGGLQEITPAGMLQFGTGAWAFVTYDYMSGSGVSPLGYSIAQLEQYLAAMNAAM